MQYKPQRKRNYEYATDQWIVRAKQRMKAIETHPRSRIGRFASIVEVQALMSACKVVTSENDSAVQSLRVMHDWLGL